MEVGAYPTLAAETPKEIRRLAAYKRVTLAPGASTEVTFNMTAEMLAMGDVNGHRSIHPGVYGLEVTRGHGATLSAQVTVASASGAARRLDTFRKWW